MRTSKQLLKGSTPILLLKILSKEEMYGYELIKALSVKSNGIFEFKEGTIYPLLHSLEDQGLLKSRNQKTKSGRKRKYYKITRNGRKELELKSKEWNNFKSSVDLILSFKAYG